MKCFKQIKNKNKNKNAHKTNNNKPKNIIHQKIRHMDITTIFVFFCLILCSVPSSSPSFLRTHSYNLPFGILSYYTIFFLYLLRFFFLFVVNFYKKKIIFLSSLKFCVVPFVCRFLGLFGLHLISFLLLIFYFLFSSDIFFLGFCCCCCWGLKEIYIIYISVLAASPDNLLLAFFFLFLYTIFFIYFIFMIFRMKQGIFNRKKVF